MTKEEYSRRLQAALDHRGYVVIASSQVRTPGEISEDSHAWLQEHFIHVQARAAFREETNFQDFVDQAQIMGMPLPGEQTRTFLVGRGFRFYRAVVE